MSKFRKKPVVVEAALFDGKRVGRPIKDDNDHIVAEPGTHPAWIPATLPTVDPVNLQDGQITKVGDKLYIKTLEGTHTASPGDWIIQGVKGELYPCKPDIFEATYEAAD